MPRKEKIANTFVSAILNSNGADGGNRTRVTTLEGWSSTTELQPRNSLADQTRIELAISSVTGRHVNRYTTDPQQRYFAIT